MRNQRGDDRSACDCWQVNGCSGDSTIDEPNAVEKVSLSFPVRSTSGVPGDRSAGYVGSKTSHSCQTSDVHGVSVVLVQVQVAGGDVARASRHVAVPLCTALPRHNHQTSVLGGEPPQRLPCYRPAAAESRTEPKMSPAI